MYLSESLTKLGSIILICMQPSKKQKTWVVECSLEASTVTIASSKLVEIFKGGPSLALDIEFR